jgi:hypothetical protein
MDRIADITTIVQYEVEDCAKGTKFGGEAILYQTPTVRSGKNLFVRESHASKLS